MAGLIVWPTCSYKQKDCMKAQLNISRGKDQRNYQRNFSVHYELKRSYFSSYCFNIRILLLLYFYLKDSFNRKVGTLLPIHA